jgi:hypothetical protein
MTRRSTSPKVVDPVTGAEILGGSGIVLTKGNFRSNDLVRVEINLGNINRENGVALTGISGSSIYVERCDSPCALQMEVNGRPDYSLPLKDGVQINTKFDRLFIYHPFYTSVGVDMKLVMYVSSKPVIDAAPVTQYNRFWSPFRILQNSVALSRVAFPVPIGARLFKFRGIFDYVGGTLGGVIAYAFINGRELTAIQLQSLVRKNPFTGVTDTYGDTSPRYPIIPTIQNTTLRFRVYLDLVDLPLPGDAYEVEIYCETVACTSSSVFFGTSLTGHFA